MAKTVTTGMFDENSSEQKADAVISSSAGKIVVEAKPFDSDPVEDFVSLLIDLQNQAVERVARANPNNIQEVAASQLAIVNSYYQGGLQQSQQSFRWSLIVGGIGCVFLVGAIVVLLFHQPTTVAWVSGVTGAAIEIFAGTLLLLYRHASEQLAQFRKSLDNTQWLLLANSMCEQLEGEIKQTTRAELIKQVGTAAVNNQGFPPIIKEKHA